MAIEAAHYEEARQALAADPIVVAMADELRGVPLDNMTHENGEPRFAFMQAANAEYRQRGGEIQAHIGAVAQAILRLVREGS